MQDFASLNLHLEFGILNRGFGIRKVQILPVLSMVAKLHFN